MMCLVRTNPMNTHTDKVLAEWPLEREGFINAIVVLMHKHFPEKIEPCPDCGMLSLHLCEKAFREMCTAFFDKIHSHTLLSQRNEILAVIEGMKLPEERGFYGPNDHLHIQHNIGYNAALADLTATLTGKEI